MDDAGRVELDVLLGSMGACRRVVADIESGDMPGPVVSDAASYVRAMTWAQANGGLQILEHLRLIDAHDREAWEQEARAIVERPHGT